MDWRRQARDRAVEHFRTAWQRAPQEGRDLLVAAAERGAVDHRWETGARACVLALLVRPALRPRETPKMAAYRLFGCEVVDDFPVTWDAGGVTLAELLGAVGIATPVRERRRGLAGFIATLTRRSAPAAG